MDSVSFLIIVLFFVAISIVGGFIVKDMPTTYKGLEEKEKEKMKEDKINKEFEEYKNRVEETNGLQVTGTNGVTEEIKESTEENIDKLFTEYKYKGDKEEEKELEDTFKLIEEKAELAQKADDTFEAILSSRYDNFDQYDEVNKIESLEVAKLVIKRLLDKLHE